MGNKKKVKKLLVTNQKNRPSAVRANKNTAVKESEYRKLLLDVKSRIHSAQYSALKAVNNELISLYWDIGKLIISRQKGDTWGKAIVEKLAHDLRKELPGISGFSASNLWRAKLFYQHYVVNRKLAPLVREIAWTHNIIILERGKDDLEREFYIRMTKKYGWTKNVLVHQIDNESYQKTLLNQINFDKTLPEKIKNQAKLAIQDEYTFEFLELGDEHSERQLETAILSKIEPFLRETGGVFSFVGSQYRLEVDEQDFFIDLLLYHRRLKCLVAMELKIGEFKPEYIGKMQFYLTALDENVREEGENPPIGIILCRSKRKTVVEYALKNASRPIGVSTYTLTKTLPMKLRKELPEPEIIAELLDVISN